MTLAGPGELITQPPVHEIGHPIHSGGVQREPGRPHVARPCFLLGHCVLRYSGSRPDTLFVQSLVDPTDLRCPGAPICVLQVEDRLHGPMEVICDERRFLLELLKRIRLGAPPHAPQHTQAAGEPCCTPIWVRFAQVATLTCSAAKGLASASSSCVSENGTNCSPHAGHRTRSSVSSTSSFFCR